MMHVDCRSSCTHGDSTLARTLVSEQVYSIVKIDRNLFTFRRPATLSLMASKLQGHFQNANDSFGQATCDDLTNLGHAPVGTDLHAAVTACVKQDHQAALVRAPVPPEKPADIAALEFGSNIMQTNPIVLNSPQTSCSAGACSCSGTGCLGDSTADRLGSSSMA